MAHKQYSLIYYHVPEDMDDPEHPNAFVLPLLLNQIEYNHIAQNFPLSGQFRFYFKCQHQKHFYWLDIHQNGVQLPHFNKQIHVRAERVSNDQVKIEKQSQPTVPRMPIEQTTPRVQTTPPMATVRRDLSDLIQF